MPPIYSLYSINFVYFYSFMQFTFLVKVHWACFFLFAFFFWAFFLFLLCSLSSPAFCWVLLGGETIEMSARLLSKIPFPLPNCLWPDLSLSFSLPNPRKEAAEEEGIEQQQQQQNTHKPTDYRLLPPFVDAFPFRFFSSF
ncbi:hypothetical protein GPALN_012630, partial [Globodera pallida]